MRSIRWILKFDDGFEFGCAPPAPGRLWDNRHMVPLWSSKTRGQWAIIGVLRAPVGH